MNENRFIYYVLYSSTLYVFVNNTGEEFRTKIYLFPATYLYQHELNSGTLNAIIPVSIISPTTYLAYPDLFKVVGQ